MEKLNLFLLFIICAWAQHTHAQAFSKLYIEGRPSMLFGSVEALNNKFYVTGVTSTIRSPYYGKAVFGKMEPDGTVDFINSLADSNSYGYSIFSNALKKSADGNFIATGDKTDSVQKAFLMKIDSNGQVLLWHEYTEVGNLIFQGEDVVELPDSGYLLAINYERANTVSQVLIIRTDINGNVINQTNYFNGIIAWPSVIRPMLNGNYMVGAWIGPASGNTPYKPKTWLIEVDRMGNQVTNWIDTTKNLWPNGMEQTADSGWIIVRQHLAYDISNIQAFNGSILKIDKYFNRQWEIDTGSGVDYNTGMFDVKILSDGNYICVGSDAIGIVVQGSAHDYGLLMKISSIGTVIWQRQYLKDSSFETNNYLNSVGLMPDDGFIACGQIQGGSLGQQGWIIRTDSNGCLIDNCGREVTDVAEVNSLPRVEIKVYPNPADNEVQFATGTVLQDAVLFIYDIYGDLILQQILAGQMLTSITTATWHRGLFFWVVRQNEMAIGQGKLEIIR